MVENYGFDSNVQLIIGVLRFADNIQRIINWVPIIFKFYNIAPDLINAIFSKDPQICLQIVNDSFSTGKDPSLFLKEFNRIY